MKHTEFKVKGFELIEKTASSDKRSSASAYVPKSWAGKRLAIIRLEALE